MSNPTPARCDQCGVEVVAQPPNLPPSGGAMGAHDDPVKGWVIESFVCGTCWEQRPQTWNCAHCAGTGPIDANFCSTCHRVRQDPVPYVLDTGPAPSTVSRGTGLPRTPSPSGGLRRLGVLGWDLIAKEERERQREHDAVVAEWDREYPGWRLAHTKNGERV